MLRLRKRPANVTSRDERSRAQAIVHKYAIISNYLSRAFPSKKEVTLRAETEAQTKTRSGVFVVIAFKDRAKAATLLQYADPAAELTQEEVSPRPPPPLSPRPAVLLATCLTPFCPLSAIPSGIPLDRFDLSISATSV